jgi:DNA mismatch endonuclease (patch repair protein)
MGLTRSQQMARIRGDNTRPERHLRSMMWAKGLRYRLQVRELPGRPDLVFPSFKTVVFVDGCFWHGCPDHYVRPRSRTLFWANKLRENVTRDQLQCRRLRSMGWRVLRLWEHEVLASAARTVGMLENALRRGGRLRRSSWRVLAVEPLDAGGTWERRTLASLHSPTRTRVERHRRHTRKWRQASAVS